HVFLTGRIADGLESDVIDLLFVGNINREYLLSIINKAEQVLGKKIRYLVYESQDVSCQKELEDKPHLLLWSA
ncbi:MAG: hypothetical protein ACPF8V_10280, partial [Luteibaculum sp.]